MTERAVLNMCTELATLPASDQPIAAATAFHLAINAALTDAALQGELQQARAGVAGVLRKLQSVLQDWTLEEATKIAADREFWTE